VFGNEEPEIAELFFEAPAKTEPEPPEMKEELTGIQSEAERLFSFDDDDDDSNLPPEEHREDEISR
jgi:hypothetical protein